MEKEVIHTKIWQEEPEADNPFAAAKCYCSGYDVYGEILEKSSWAEYLYLLFKLEKPQSWQTDLLEKIAIAIANPGIRDHSVRAAMNAGVGGSTSASALMAALAVGAGNLNGGHEIYCLMEWWHECGEDLQQWRTRMKELQKSKRATIWSEFDRVPGFDPHGVSCTTPTLQTLTVLEKISHKNALTWLRENRQTLEIVANSPLSMTSVIAAAYVDLELSAEQAEMIYLLMRLPGAAVHALEQKQMGWKKYPFFGDALKIANTKTE